MPKIYLDTSAYNRPFDDQAQPKIFLEAQAVAIILQMIETELFKLVSSSVLEYENSRNPYPIKQEAMNRSLKTAQLRQEVNEPIQQRAEQLNVMDSKPLMHCTSPVPRQLKATGSLRVTSGLSIDALA
jgi:hypothetical protein